ncbi:MAG TPA: phosphatase PAP2 family protein [Verrucomicrobiae bacterium]|nr:phosphatase PAP2 family protein [Verrucomicrobiae bacterium]
MNARAAAERQWLTAAMIAAIPGSMMAAALVNALSFLRPLKLDLYIYKIDGLLTFQPSFAMGCFLRQFPLLRAAAFYAYNAMPFAMIAVMWLYVRKGWPALPLVRTLTWNLFAALPVYLLVPVAGPMYAFASFPNLPHGVSPHPIPIAAPPNGVPSVHFSTAILIYLFARRSPLGRTLAWLYLLLTFVSTLGFGEHYLFDLVMALPYALTIWKYQSK